MLVHQSISHTTRIKVTWPGKYLEIQVEPAHPQEKDFSMELELISNSPGQFSVNQSEFAAV